MVKFDFSKCKIKTSKPKVDNRIYNFIKKGDSIFIDDVEYRKIKDG